MLKNFGADVVGLAKNYNTLNVMTGEQIAKVNDYIDALNTLKDTNALTTDSITGLYNSVKSLNSDSLTYYFQSVAEGAKNARVNIVDAYTAILDGNTHGLKNVQSIFNTYNNTLKGNEENQKAFTKAVGQSNSSLAKYLTTVGTNGTANLKGYAGQLVKTTAQTVLLTAKTIALQAAISIGLSLAINGLITLITEVVNRQKELVEQAKESAEKVDEQAKSLDELKEKYKEICDSADDEKTKNEKLNEIKQELIDVYGFEKDALKELNDEREKGLELLDDEITKNRINSAETWLTENNDAYEDAKKKLTSSNNSAENSVIAQANVVTQVTKDTLKEYSDSFDEILKQFSISNPTADNPLAQIKIKGSNTLQQYENLNNVLNDITSIKVTKGLNKAEEELYNSLLAKQKAYKKVVTDDIVDIYETGNKYTGAIKLYNFETDDGINFNNVTQDTYKEFRDKFLESLGFGDKKDSTDFALDIEQTLLDMMPDFEKVYRGIEDNATDIAQETNDAISNSAETASKSLEDLQKAYDELSKSASNYTKNQKSITSALEEQEKYGQLSASTIQELTEAGYAQALAVDEETGAVTLNKTAYEQLNEEKKRAIILEGEQQKSELATKLQEEKKAIEELGKEYADANEERKKAILLEMEEHGASYNDIQARITNINKSLASLDAPTFEDGKEETPTEIQNFLDDYAQYHHDINMGIKKEDEDYFNWLDKTAHDAYSKYPDYLDDLWKYEEEVYKGRKQLAEDYFDEEQKLFEDRVSNLETQIEITTKTSESSDGTKLNTKEKYDYISSAYQEIINEIEERINEIVQAGVEGHEEILAELEKQLDEYKEKLDDVFKDEIEEEKDYIEKQKEAYSDLYDERIDKIKEQQEAAEEAAQAEIDAIQEKIDALEKANDTQQEAIDIEKARQALENAKKQRTRAVIGSDGSMTYKIDEDAVQEAQEEYDKLLLEQQINLLEDQKDVLEAAKDKQSEAYDEIIENLESQKEEGERQFDVLLKALDEYLNPDKSTSNVDVWSELAKMQGAQYKNGVWADKDGNAIDLSALIKSVETESNTEKTAGVTSNTEDKTDSVIDSFFAKLEKTHNLEQGSLTLEKVMSILTPSMNFNPYGAMNERINKAYSSGYVNNVNNNNSNSNITVGDIHINNPIGSANDLAAEIVKKLPVMIDKEIHSVRK